MILSLTTLAAKALAQAGEGPYMLGEEMYKELEYARFCANTPLKDRTTEAARLGNSEWLRKLHKEGVKFHSLTAVCAAMFGHPECMRVAIESGCPWDPYTTAWAASSGNPECIRIARKLGCEWHPLTRTCAGTKEVTAVLDELECP